jgi:hypothetical protein
MSDTTPNDSFSESTWALINWHLRAEAFIYPAKLQ